MLISHLAGISHSTDRKEQIVEKDYEIRKPIENPSSFHPYNTAMLLGS